MKPLSKGNLFASKHFKPSKSVKSGRVSRILKDAYQLYLHDKYTRLALKRCLG